jgi:hypothetical protein
MSGTAVESENTSPATANSAPDWETLKRSLGASTAQEAQQRAYDIAKFVADVENDSNSELILKTGNKSVKLNLNR